MKIENMTGRSGKEVANQFIIFTPEATFFQSYKSIIVKITFEDGERVIYLDENAWNYSKTGKYRNQFLDESKAETEKKIKSGVYKLVDLNNEA